MRPASLLSFALTALEAFAATTAEWRSQSIYFLLTDRFVRTDSSTTAECDSQMGLDYIQGMGFTAEYTTYGQAYHGYWQQDIYSINHNYGTEDDLRDLAQALHDRGMYLMVDVVANHMGFSGARDSVDYSVFQPFNSQDYFHTPCSINSEDDQAQVENCWLGDNEVALPDLDTSRDDVRELWYDWIGLLVSNYSIDGIRIDTAKHIQKDFWQDFNDAAGVYCIGEVLDGVLNYPIYFNLLRAFQSTSGSISDLANMIDWVKNDCPDSTLLGTFIENHDNPRFASYNTDIAFAENVAAFHYSGAGDPFNREATWLSGYSTESRIYQLIAKANVIRSHAISQDAEWVNNKIVTVLTNSGSGVGSYTLHVTGTGYTAGSSVTEIVSRATITVSDSGSVPVYIENGKPGVLFPTDKLAGSGICE
ncbi:glycoside hydrolase superfamily [Aspergillus crustosus]